VGVVSRFQIPPDLSVAQVVEHTPTFFYMTTIAQRVEQSLGTMVCRWFDSIFSRKVNRNLVGDGTMNLFVVKYRRVRDPNGKKVKN